MVSLIDKHGLEILRTNKNKKHSISERQEAVNRVLIGGEPIWTVAIDIGLLSSEILNNWINNYKKMDYNIVERKIEHPTMPKEIKKKGNETDKEKIKRLEEKDLYLKAELEHTKKLRAAVQARKNQQQKKK